MKLKMKFENRKLNWMQQRVITRRRAMLAAAIVAAGLVAMPVGAAGSWELDKSTSSITFSVDSRLGAVDGVFHKWQMDAEVPSDLNKGSGRIVVDVASIDTQNRRRDNHLRDPDFFEVETYPTAVFTITSVDADPDADRVRVTGSMQIKDVTRTETIVFRKNETDDRLELSGRVIIDRTDYGITYDSIFNPIDDEVILRMKLVFKR